MQNIAAGSTFPTSPMYAVVETYSDSACTTISYGNSYVLDTCLASASASSKYTCGKHHSMFQFKNQDSLFRMQPAMLEPCSPILM